MVNADDEDIRCRGPVGQRSVHLSDRLLSIVTYKIAILQAPDANRKIELLTFTLSVTLAFAKRRELCILGGHELAFADSCIFCVGVGDPDQVGQDCSWGPWTVGRP